MKFMTATTVTFDVVKVVFAITIPLDIAKNAKEIHVDAVVVVRRYSIVIVVVSRTVRNATHGTPPTHAKGNVAATTAMRAKRQRS